MGTDSNLKFIYSSSELKMIAQKMLDLAHGAGATQASVDVTEDYGLSTQVRLGQLETSENNREKSASITIYDSGRKGFAETSNFESGAIQQTDLKTTMP